jgi:hypothetical protein
MLGKLTRYEIIQAEITFILMYVKYNENTVSHLYYNKCNDLQRIYINWLSTRPNELKTLLMKRRY